MKEAKTRIDLLLAEQGFFTSRERAQAALMAGLVLVDGQKVEKPGTLVPRAAAIRLLGDGLPYVSRGGLKLEKALAVFALDLQGKIMLDIGASTGGFTDCALKHGASKVYAVDVGYGQLAWSLRQDARVVSMERVNARYLSPGQIPEAVDFVTIDVSFISLQKILPTTKNLLVADGLVVALVKPQFEAGREHIEKKGVVRAPQVHEQVLSSVLSCAQASGFVAKGLDFSPVRGPQGNIEYLLCLGQTGAAAEARIAEIVALAHINTK